MLIEILEEIDKYRNKEGERKLFRESCEGMKDLCNEIDDLIAQLPEDNREESVMLLIIYLISHIKLRQAATVTKDIPELLKAISHKAVTSAPKEARDTLWEHIREVNKILRDNDEQCKD